MAIVRGLVVENVIELADGARWDPPAGTVVVPADANAEPGGGFDGAAFTRAPIPAAPVDRLAELEARLAVLETKP